MPFTEEMEKIEKVEKEGGWPESCVMMHFPEPGITIHGYTDEMRAKMVACFAQSDVDPLWQGIVDSLRTFLN